MVDRRRKSKRPSGLAPNDQYDIALIAVRRDQVASVVPGLAANHRIPILIFMLNNPTGSSDLAQALGRDRVLLGFPGAGGTRDRHLVRYAMIAQQPTTLGELDGRPNSAPAQTGRNIPAVRISYGDVSRHGRVAKGARLLRDFRQWRDLQGWWRLSPTLRR
jgi:ketopantoate reductase